MAAATRPTGRPRGATTRGAGTGCADLTDHDFVLLKVAVNAECGQGRLMRTFRKRILIIVKRSAASRSKWRSSSGCHQTKSTSLWISTRRERGLGCRAKLRGLFGIFEFPTANSGPEARLPSQSPGPATLLALLSYVGDQLFMPIALCAP